MSPGAFRALGLGLALLLLLYLLLPLGVVVALSLSPSTALGVASEQWASTGGRLAAFRYVLDTYGGHLATSLALALATGAVALAVGAPAGVALGLARRTPLARAVEVLVTLPLAVPGLAAALALLTAFGARDDRLLLLVGHALYTVPYATRTVAAAARAGRLGAVLEAARTLGAGRRARARRVLLPHLRPALVAAALLAVAVSFGEFNVTFLLASPAHGTFPTALYLAYTTNSFPVAAAATTLLLAGLAPLLALALLLGAGAEPGV